MNFSLLDCMPKVSNWVAGGWIPRPWQDENIKAVQKSHHKFGFMIGSAILHEYCMLIWIPCVELWYESVFQNTLILILILLHGTLNYE